MSASTTFEVLKYNVPGKEDNTDQYLIHEFWAIRWSVLEFYFIHIFSHDAELRFIIMNNLKRDSMEIQHPKFKNSRLGLLESVHDRIESILMVLKPRQETSSLSDIWAHARLCLYYFDKAVIVGF